MPRLAPVTMARRPSSHLADAISGLSPASFPSRARRPDV
jgi:hypothetical protein